MVAVGGVLAYGSAPAEFGQSEVQDLEASVLRDEQVFRFEVTMNNSGVVSGGQTARNIHPEIAGIPQTHGATAKAITQGLALQQLGDDVRRSVVLTDVEDRNNIGMIESGSGLRLQFEATETIRIPRPGVSGAP